MLIYDLADPQELQGFVRGVQQEQERNVFVLAQFLPNDNIDGIDWRVTKGELRDQDAAVVRSWDTPAPIGDRQGISRIMGELPPISKKMRLGEEERLRLRMLERAGDASEIISKIFDDVSNLGRSVAARVELFRGEVLETGEINIDENGVEQSVDFGRKTEFDAAANTLAGADKWSDHTGSDPVENLITWTAAYRDENGIDPALGLTSTAVINHLLRNDAIRALAATVAGAPQLVTRVHLAQVLSAFGLPPLVAYDTKVRVNGTQVPVISADKVILLPPSNEPLGRTFFGTTAEAIELQGAQQISADQAPGLTAVVEKTFDPVSTWTKVSAIALPTLVNPNLTFVAGVV